MRERKSAATNRARAAAEAGNGGPQPNSAARKSLLDPYHELAATFFDMADTPEMEVTFLNAAKVRGMPHSTCMLRQYIDLSRCLDCLKTPFVCLLISLLGLWSNHN
jgi:hypothetical protein